MCPLKRKQLGTYTKTFNVWLKDRIIKLKEERGLMTKLLVLSRTRPNIDLPALFKEHEFTITPRALFASDGTPHHMTDKSALLKAVEVLGPVTADEVDLDNHQVNVIVLDGMALY